MATMAGIVLQAYPLYVLIEWSADLPKWLYPYLLVFPKARLSYLALLLIYCAGYCVVNGMVTSEFLRKTQLEADQIAARQIQQTLQPQQPDPIPGYALETIYLPFREVSGDYFDVIPLSASQSLFALADVSGKGMPAALLAANIQALVRSIASTTTDPAKLAEHINQHLVRYTPGDRFATAVFIVLDHVSGILRYVNAGHNPPLLSTTETCLTLTATGLPLGLLKDAKYHTEVAEIHAGNCLLMFTDGLTDAISGEDPEACLCDALKEHRVGTMAALRSLVDSKSVADDVTILLIRRDTSKAADANHQFTSARVQKAARD